MSAWNQKINDFITLANKNNVRMLMVGGAAVNFYGYQRHSADVDFWIDTNLENLNNLKTVFNAMGYDLDDFPEKVKNREQNISLKFSPVDLDLELITNFTVNKSFEQAYTVSIVVSKKDNPEVKWRVLNLDDLITSKIKSGRPKDLLDVQELSRINKL